MSGHLYPGFELQQSFPPLIGEEVDQIDPANCRAVAERRFAPTVMATTYLELYERCLRSIPTVRRQTTPLRRHSFS